MANMSMPRVGAMSTGSQALKTSGSEAYYKSNLDLVLRENKQLKQKLDQLERENKDLKKSVYDLSVRHSACLDQSGKPPHPFDIDSLFTPDASRPELISSSLLTEVVNNTLRDREARHGSKQQHQHTDGRQFQQRHELKGHVGSVYAASFSEASNLLASGSFDQTVRVWDYQAEKELLCFAEHQLNVSDVCWSRDGGILLSGGFDHCCKEWDVAAEKLLHSYAVTHGFIQAVRFSPGDNNSFVAGSTSKHVFVFDRRLWGSSSCAMALENDAKVNAVFVYPSGQAVLSGDSHGAIKLWDLRHPGQCLDSRFNEDAHKPISSMDVSRAQPDDSPEEGGRWLAVNSYDNILRVYERQHAPPNSAPPLPLSGQPQQLALTGLRLANAIKGTRNKNWTVKSSLYHGPNYRDRPAHARQKAVLLDGLRNGESRSRRSPDDPVSDTKLSDSLLLATGSADNVAFLYDVSAEGSAELVQRLEGHTDRVCSAVFHPIEPTLATCSADFTIKIWSPRTQEVQ